MKAIPLSQLTRAQRARLIHLPKAPPPMVKCLRCSARVIAGLCGDCLEELGAREFEPIRIAQ